MQAGTLRTAGSRCVNTAAAAASATEGPGMAMRAGCSSAAATSTASPAATATTRPPGSLYSWAGPCHQHRRQVGRNREDKRGKEFEKTDHLMISFSQQNRCGVSHVGPSRLLTLCSIHMSMFQVARSSIHPCHLTAVLLGGFTLTLLSRRF